MLQTPYDNQGAEWGVGEKNNNNNNNNTHKIKKGEKNPPTPPLPPQTKQNNNNNNNKTKTKTFLHKTFALHFRDSLFAYIVPLLAL